MARLRPIKSVRVLTVEEKTRVANFFMLLIEVNLQKGITSKRRTPKSAKAKKCNMPFKAFLSSEALCEGGSEVGCKTQKIKGKPIGKQSPIKRTSRTRSSSRTTRRDLYLKPFARIFKGNVFKYIMGYSNARHYCINTPSGIIHYHQS